MGLLDSLGVIVAKAERINREFDAVKSDIHSTVRANSKEAGAVIDEVRSVASDMTGALQSEVRELVTKPEGASAATHTEIKTRASNASTEVRAAVAPIVSEVNEVITSVTGS